MKASKIITSAIVTATLASTALAQSSPVKPAIAVSDSGSTIAIAGLALVGIVALRRRFSK